MTGWKPIPLQLQDLGWLDRLLLDQSLDQIVNGDSVCFGSKGRHDPVTEHRQCQRLHIVDGNVRSSL